MNSLQIDTNGPTQEEHFYPFSHTLSRPNIERLESLKRKTEEKLKK